MASSKPGPANAVPAAIKDDGASLDVGIDDGDPGKVNGLLNTPPG